MSWERSEFNIFNLPSNLYKYYPYDSNLNPKRLAGEIYLASPYDFNDPCDCQRSINNNSKEKVDQHGKDWLIKKMQELDYNEQESNEIADSLLNNEDNCVKDVRKRMLERLGVFCLTNNFSDSLMWGYYANNDGICIEYDVAKIVRNLVIGYVNKMSYTTTRHLFEHKEYCLSPEERISLSQSNTAEITEKINNAKKIIKLEDIKVISNRFLDEQNNESKTLNFVRNVLLKRVYAKSIIYDDSQDISESPLFFTKGEESSEEKYFKKTKVWEHEKEFRFIVSLGGRLVINLGTECIKSIYLGCNISNEKIIAITYLMAKNKLKCKLHKMKRDNCKLNPQLIDWRLNDDQIDSFEKIMREKFSTE